MSQAVSKLYKIIIHLIYSYPSIITKTCLVEFGNKGTQFLGTLNCGTFDMWNTSEVDKFSIKVVKLWKNNLLPQIH